MKKITFIIILILSSFDAFAQPANDDCTGAIDLTSNIGVTCSNTTFSFNGNENNSGIDAPSCGSYSGKDLWYKFTMPNDSAVRIKASAEVNIDDLALSVYSGTCGGTLTEIACDDDSNPDPFPDSLFPQVDISESGGSILYIRVWDLNDFGAGSSFNLCLYKVDPPLVALNDECSTAETLTLSNDCSTQVLKTFNQATASPDDDPSCANNEEADVWFEIQVDNDQEYDISIETTEDSGSNVTDTGIAVYSGSCGSLTEIACDDDGGTNLFSKINLSALQGTTLFVRVFPVATLGQTGTFNICATKTPTLGLEDKSINHFTMYPNPAKEVVNLKFNQLSSHSIKVNIYNIQGKLVHHVSKTLNNQAVQLDISSLSTGMYFLKVNDGVNESTKKLMVK